MVIRVFRARVQPGKQAAFERYFREVGLPRLRSQDGLIECYAGRPADQNPYEFVAVSIWRDVDALKTYVGQHWQDTSPTQEQEHLLREIFVHHYDALE